MHEEITSTWQRSFGEGESASLGPVPRRHVRALTVAAVAGIGLLNIGDVATTKMLLKRSAVEANPLAGALLSSGSLLWVKLGAIAILALLALRFPPKLGVLVGAWGVLGLYGAVLLSNLLILRIT